VSTALGRSYRASLSSGPGKALEAVLILIAMLTVLITVVAGLGVLNAVALQIRDRAHDIGVLKAIGMTARQTLAMIVCSVAVTGLVAVNDLGVHPGGRLSCSPCLAWLSRSRVRSARPAGRLAPVPHSR